MRSRKQRAFVLVELITVLAIIVFASGVATMVFHALMNANSRTAHFADRYAELQSFLAAVERDVRCASVIETPGSSPSYGDTTQSVTELVLVGPSSRVVYRVNEEGVTRTTEASPQPTRTWGPFMGTVVFDVRRDASGKATVLTASVTWRRTDHAEFQPRSTFELVARCASQEVDHDD